MHLLRITFIVIQVAAVVEAAKIKWTLHKSCYRNAQDTANDNALAQNMINAVNSAIAWAARAQSKLDAAVSILPIGKETKDLVKPLLGESDFDTAAKDIRDKMKRVADLDGPVGMASTPDDKRYERSPEWISLESSDDHHNNLIITCRPELIRIQDIERGTGNQVPYDIVRKKLLTDTDILQTFLNQENAPGANWNTITGQRVFAVTQVDKPPPSGGLGGRLHVPETINFHPLYIRNEQVNGFAGWTDQLLSEVSASDALEVFKAKGMAKNPPITIRPIDGLLEASIVKTMLHEFFHLNYFGGMLDDPSGAYGWSVNTLKNNRQNPDLLAIIGAVIELRNRNGKKYTVSAEGAVIAV